MAASTFGPIEPDAKWPAAAYASISPRVTRPMSWASGVPQPATACATSVAMTSDVGVDGAGEQGGREVLVDDRLDAVDAAVGAAHDGDAARRRP